MPDLTLEETVRRVVERTNPPEGTSDAYEYRLVSNSVERTKYFVDIGGLQSTDRCKSLYQELRRIREMDRNNNERPSDLAIEQATQSLDAFIDFHFPPNRIVISADGGLGLVFHQGDRYADIEFFNDGEIAAIAKDNERREIWPLGIGEGHSQETIEKIHAFFTT